MRQFFHLFLLIIPTFLKANDEQEQFTIYINGEIEGVVSVYQYVGMLSSEISRTLTLQEYGLMQSILWVGIIISVYFAADQIRKGNIKGGIIQLGWIIALIGFFIYPRAQVNIIDTRVYKNANPTPNGTFAPIANIPYFLALSTSFATSITNELAHTIDNAMSPVDGLKYTSVGIGKNYELLTKMIELSSSVDDNDTVYEKTRQLKSYIQECILPQFEIYPYKANKLFNSREDIIDALAPVNYNISNETNKAGQSCKDEYDDIRLNGISIIESSLYDRLRRYYEQEYGNNFDQFSDDTANVLMGLNSGLSAVVTARRAILNTAVSASIIPKAVEGGGVGVSGLNLAQEITSALSKHKIMMRGLGEFKWMSEMLPHVMNYLFSLIIALYIPMSIVAMVLGYASGIKIYKNYVFGLISFQMITVSFAIIQNVINMYGGNSVVDLYNALGSNLFTVNNIPYLIQHNAMMSGLAGIFGLLAIPLTIGVIFKGNVAAFNGLVGRIQGMYEGNDLNTATRLMKKKMARSIGEEREASIYKDAYKNLEGDELEKFIKRNGVAPMGAEMAEVKSQVTADINKYAKDVSQSHAIRSSDEYYTSSRVQGASAVSGQIGLGEEIKKHGESEGLMKYLYASRVKGRVKGKAESVYANKVKAKGEDTIVDGEGHKVARQTSHTLTIGEHGSDKAASLQGVMDGRGQLAKTQGLVELGENSINKIAQGIKQATIKDYSNQMQYGKRVDTKQKAIDAGVMQADSTAAVDLALAKMKQQGKQETLFNSNKIVATGSFNDTIGIHKGIKANLKENGGSYDIYSKTAKYNKKEEFAVFNAKIDEAGGYKELIKLGAINANIDTNKMIQGINILKKYEFQGSGPVLDKNGKLTQVGRDFYKYMQINQEMRTLGAVNGLQDDKKRNRMVKDVFKYQVFLKSAEIDGNKDKRDLVPYEGRLVSKEAIQEALNMNNPEINKMEKHSMIKKNTSVEDVLSDKNIASSAMEVVQSSAEKLRGVITADKQMGVYGTVIKGDLDNDGNLRATTEIGHLGIIRAGTTVTNPEQSVYNQSRDYSKGLKFTQLYQYANKLRQNPGGFKYITGLLSDPLSASEHAYVFAKIAAAKYALDSSSAHASSGDGINSSIELYKHKRATQVFGGVAKFQINQ
jgi:hypothetical protein